MIASEEIVSRLISIEEKLKQNYNAPMNFHEACEYMGFSPSYLYRLTCKNIIPHYKPSGKRLYFFRKELDDWICKGNVDPSATLRAGLRMENPPNERRTGGELKVKDGSAPSSTGSELRLTTKDPNQLEMKLNVEDEKRDTEEKDASTSSAQEIVIEFPLKSRRNK